MTDKFIAMLGESDQFATGLNESSLSRIWKQVSKFESGTISAFRKFKTDGTPFTKKENLKRNGLLAAKLVKLNYGFTEIKGYSQENYDDKKVETVENSFMVVDLNEQKSLKKDLIDLGVEFDQDNITFSLPNGEYYLIWTKEIFNHFVGEEEKLGRSLFGHEGQFYSRVKGRPFVFTTIKGAVVESNKTLSNGYKLGLHLALMRDTLPK